MAITIGDKEIVFQCTFLAKDDEAIKFDVDVRGTKMKMCLTFRASGDAPRTGAWHVQNDVLMMEFHNWSDPLAAGTAEPAKLGDVKGESLWFQMAHHGISGLHLCHFFVLAGGLPNG